MQSYLLIPGTVSNCNFTDNRANDAGGAVYFFDIGEVMICNFTNNTASQRGGAVDFFDRGTVTNCNFTKNRANNYGGAVFFDYGKIMKCNLTGNSAGVWGGALLFEYSQNETTGSVTLCYFDDNNAQKGIDILSQNWNGVAVDTCFFQLGAGTTFNTINYPPTLIVDDFTTSYKSGEKLTFDLKTHSGIPLNDSIRIDIYFPENHTWFAEYSCLSTEGWVPDLPVGSYYALYNVDYAECESIKRTVNITPMKK